MQDLVEGNIYVMSKMRKIVVAATNSYYYIATVNGNLRLNMSADVSAKMDHAAQANQFSVLQMLSLFMEMKAVRRFNGELGEMCLQLVIQKYGGWADLGLDSDDDSDKNSNDTDEIDLERLDEDEENPPSGIQTQFQFDN